MPAQPFLLPLQLAPERDEDNGNGEQAAPSPNHDRAAQEEQQEASVDGVPNKAVGAALDQFVIVLELDGGAPVAAQECTGMDAQRGSGHAKTKAGREQGVGVRQETLP